MRQRELFISVRDNWRRGWKNGTVDSVKTVWVTATPKTELNRQNAAEAEREVKRVVDLLCYVSERSMVCLHRVSLENACSEAASLKRDT